MYNVLVHEVHLVLFCIKVYFVLFFFNLSQSVEWSRFGGRRQTSQCHCRPWHTRHQDQPKGIVYAHVYTIYINVGLPIHVVCSAMAWDVGFPCTRFAVAIFHVGTDLKCSCFSVYKKCNEFERSSVLCIV